MKNTLIGFVAGALTASLAFFMLDQRPMSSVERDDTEIEPASRTVQEVPQPTIATSGSASAQSDSPDNDSNGSVSEASFSGLSVTGRSREEMIRLWEQSFDYWSNNKDRFDSFANEVRDTSPVATTLENSVTSEVWRVAGGTYPPSFSDTECRSSACRVRLSYGTLEELSAATRSNLDLWMLAGLELYGFVSVDKTPEGDFRAFDPDPNAPGETLDIYFWRESQEAR